MYSVCQELKYKEQLALCSEFKSHGVLVGSFLCYFSVFQTFQYASMIKSQLLQKLLGLEGPSSIDLDGTVVYGCNPEKSQKVVS